MSPADPALAKKPQTSGVIGRLRSFFGKPQVETDVVAAIENGENDMGKNLSPARREMIERVVAFDEKRVSDVMAPRVDIFAIDLDTPLEELIRVFSEAGHSRMPIYRGDLDDPVGMVHIKDVVGLIANQSVVKKTVTGNARKNHVLSDIRRDILYVPPSMLVTDLLLRMQAVRIHMALVIDEYGGTDGLVTIEDLVEEIVGEINDEHDEEETPIVVATTEGGWDVDARVELEEFESDTGFRLVADDDEEIDTVGGYVVSLAGRVPRRGEVILGPDGFDFEITEADARKVRKLRIRPANAKPKEAAE